MHTVKETDMLATKLDLLMKTLDERATEKDAMHGTVKAMDLHMTCKVCGEVGHSGNDCPETREDAAYINNRFRPHGGNNQSRFQHNNSNFNSNFNLNYNSNKPSLKDLVLGQAKINENLMKKLVYNDEILENINSKLEGLTSSVKNQLSFNKMI